MALAVTALRQLRIAPEGAPKGHDAGAQRRTEQERTQQVADETVPRLRT